MSALYLFTLLVYPLDFALKLAIAFLLGAAIGFERQWQHRSAGLRTNTLVSLGSAAFVLISETVTGHTGDVTRIAGQIVTGIGFLGSGVIMRDGLNVQGLNTAATIWCSAAVGSLAGFGLFLEAILTAAAVILAHLTLRPLGKLLNRRYGQRSGPSTSYLVFITALAEVENAVRGLLMQAVSDDETLAVHALKSSEQRKHPIKASKHELSRHELNKQEPNAMVIIVAEILTTGKQDKKIEAITSRLLLERGVSEARWEVRTPEQEY
jgi:putative Mg2+ transporter-C (MgtC) family protein